jgi:hypothetical protein
MKGDYSAADGAAEAAAQAIAATLAAPVAAPAPAASDEPAARTAPADSDVHADAPSGAPPSPHAITAALFPTPSYFATIEALLDDVSLHSSLQQTSVTVPAGLAHVATTTVDLAVLSENKRASVSDSVVVWEFATSAFDIALSVHFNGVEVRPYARYPSHLGVVRDAFIVPHETLAASAREDGTPAPVVTFRFDNSYSRLRPKMLRYRIAVVKRSCAAAVAAGERALPLLTKMYATLLREDSASSASSSSTSTSTASSYDELSPLRS